MNKLYSDNKQFSFNRGRTEPFISTEGKRPGYWVEVPFAVIPDRYYVDVVRKVPLWRLEGIPGNFRATVIEQHNFPNAPKVESVLRFQLVLDDGFGCTTFTKYEVFLDGENCEPLLSNLPIFDLDFESEL